MKRKSKSKSKSAAGLPKVLYAACNKGGHFQSDEDILNVVDADGGPCVYGIYELKRIATGRVVVEVKDEQPA